MASRNTGFGTALRYKGREGMWAWLLHRVTGLGILAFLLIHVVDTAVVIYWPDLYDESLHIYRSPLFRFAELVIFFAVLYHALNGLRIIIQDFWPIAMRRQRQLAWAVAAVTIVGMIPVTWLMLRPLFGGPEPGEDRMREREQQTVTVMRDEPPAGHATSPLAANGEE
jgi:succinate dehydrogenase / fumarate reductase cytochrome b subunit